MFALQKKIHSIQCVSVLPKIGTYTLCRRAHSGATAAPLVNSFASFTARDKTKASSLYLSPMANGIAYHCVHSIHCCCSYYLAKIQKVKGKMAYEKSFGYKNKLLLLAQKKRGRQRQQKGFIELTDAATEAEAATIVAQGECGK